MNLFFDTAAQPKSATAQLDIYFDDLDLVNVSDPMYFFESLSFSYWNSDTNSYSQIGGTIDETSELTSGAFSGAASTDLPLVPTPSDDPFTWSLDLAALGILDQVDDGFWIQLGFGSDFSGHKGRNTPEYLTAELTVSPVPLPSAVWLFGSALLGFIGMSRRTRV